MNEIELKKMELEFKREELERKFKMGLAEKMKSVTKDMSYFELDGNNTFSKYSYMTYSQMFEKLTESFNKNGLASSIELVEFNAGDKNGNRYVDIKGEITVTDTDTGYSKTVTWYADGYDKGDKAFPKANTILMKTWIQSTFLVAVGEDPDQSTMEQIPEPKDKSYNKMPSNNKNDNEFNKPPYDNKKDLKSQLTTLIVNKYCNSTIVGDVLKKRGFTFNDVVNIDGSVAEQIYKEV